MPPMIPDSRRRDQREGWWTSLSCQKLLAARRLALASWWGRKIEARLAVSLLHKEWLETRYSLKSSAINFAQPVDTTSAAGILKWVLCELWMSFPPSKLLSLRSV
jgi:hypothetical protein